MWVVFGTKVTTERVPNGRRVERHCDKCGELAMFYERRAMTKLQLYFIDILDYGKRRVMACGACGELYATDELGDATSSDSQAPEWVSDAKATVGKLADAAKVGLGRIREAAARELGSSSRDEAPPATDDPLADDDAALEAKFRVLEKKYRIE